MALQRFDPIFPVSDLPRALAHYEKMGFEVRSYEDVYGFATRDGCELHLGTYAHPEDEDHRHSHTTAYLRVDDADALAVEWRAAGVEVHGPEGTAWGQREGATVDPDGNVIRFGSPLP
jgi:predicted enzyme related to lactoylglutathione lyase